MVWDIQNAQDEVEGLLTRHVRETLERIASDDAEQRARHHEVARSVATFVADEAGGGIRSDALWAHVSRALWSVGEGEAAREVLHQHIEPAAIRRTLDQLLSVGDLSPAVWRLVTAGAIRYQPEWISSPHQAVWILDLRRMFQWTGDMDLARLALLKQVVAQLAPLWDAARGEGALGVCWESTHGRRYDTHSVRTCAEWMARCEQFLKKEGERRAWDTIPALQRVTF